MSRYNLSKLGVLIVDDDDLMREILRSTLRGFGISNIFEAADGLHAGELMETFAADLIITDWNMPRVDGLALVELVRSGDYGSDPFVPIIMVSGYREEARVAGAANCGIHEYLAKPITARTLYARIVNLIENPLPFVRTETYFGPDRRSGTRSFDGPERRSSKSSPPPAKAAARDGAAQTKGTPGAFEMIAPPLVLSNKVGADGPDQETAIADGEAAITGMNGTYRDRVAQELAALREALARARSERQKANDHLWKIFSIAHNIRGQASSYNYPLLARIGDSLCRYIEALKEVDEPQLQVIELHSEVMSRVIADQIKNENNHVGRTLLAGLRKVVAKVKA